MKIRTVFSAGTAAALALSLSVVIVPLASADNVTAGSYNPVAASRLVDTRIGQGAPAKALASHNTLTFSVTAGITAPIAAVALNVTAVSPNLPGYLTVHAAGSALTTTSNLNFYPGEDVPNMVITRVSAGKVSIYNGSAGPVQIVVDRYGYFLGGSATAPGTLVTMDSQRILDTRTGVGTNGVKMRVPAFGNLTFKVAGAFGIPTDATAAVINLTAAQGTQLGDITAYAGDPRPLASNLNYFPYQDRANLSLQQINAADGTVTLYNHSNGTVDLVADVSGYFIGGAPAADGSFLPSTSNRLLDTRLSALGPLPAHATLTLGIFPAGEDFSIFKSVVINVTVTKPAAAGYLTTWSGGARPTISSANFRPGHDTAGLLVLPVNTTNNANTISIYNGSSGPADIVVDLTGYVLADISVLPATQSRAARSTFSSRLATALAAVKAAHPAGSSGKFSISAGN